MSSIRREFPDLPPVWAMALAVLAWGAGRYVPILRFDGALVDFAGIMLLGLGIVLAAWSAFWFRSMGTTIEPRDRPSALIVEGPFRLNRNPIYTGMAVSLLGLALILGALSSLLVIVLFVPIVTRRFVRGEEAALRGAFGEDAERYMARTRRW